ncbi:hypothetical protein ROZALSC1DRAFT_28273 [Rozella allomycis CSF55]|uniref:Uncharacterized protein n=1 Tax=Rozella allomycis (strain CSF55) TaxID=988480 RepID=A0A075AUQ0_ROZAC|nr:hypothetical protein O9G_002453 [Rozella allomycis CSF55]RKP20224.1 hypothetical protein ROZALSC1DRAFT_28273 [Rozella allomycis CSF55]|eukprot:EPZ33890.1 hypothetical protein O9G_002453 [Rozella allomycis CSF55]
MASLVWNDALMTLTVIYALICLKLLLESFAHLKRDKSRGRIAQICVVISVISQFVINLLIFNGGRIGCGILEVFNATFNWYFAFVLYYCIQYAKLYALVRHCYPSYARMTKILMFWIISIYVGTSIGFSAMTKVSPTCNHISYNGTFFDIVGVGIIESFNVAFNFLIYFKLSKLPKNRWLIMQKKFLYNAIISASYLIISCILVNIVESSQISEVLYNTQLLCISYVSFYTANCIMKTAKVDVNALNDFSSKSIKIAGGRSRLNSSTKNQSRPIQ